MKVGLVDVSRDLSSRSPNKPLHCQELFHYYCSKPNLFISWSDTYIPHLNNISIVQNENNFLPYPNRDEDENVLCFFFFTLCLRSTVVLVVSIHICSVPFLS
jgi:hypothetical protein